VSLFRAFPLILICALSGFAHGEDTLTLTASTALANKPELVPEWLPSARNIKIELSPTPPSSPEIKTESASESVSIILPAATLPVAQVIEAEAALDADAAISDNKTEFVPESDSTIEINAEPPPVWLSGDSTPIEMTTDPTGTGDSLWARIRNGFVMREFDSELIGRHEEWYASRPEYVKRMTDRARRYLYFITGEVEKRGMPSEIALLPMIESAFNPGAMSSTRASGIWQFMPATGKSFGLKQNWWHDDRRDVIGATNGALDYLQKLYRMFGDWQLALAAYNWGEGSVQRAQARNRKLGLATDYPSLKMPAETRNYVPKLLAIKNIIANPERFGIRLSDIPDEPYFAAVATTQHIDVKLAAELADISMEEFNALNPEHNRPVILQGKSDVILLPVDKAETFRANLENYDKPLVSWQSYQPKRGERLDELAPRFGLSVANLKAVNGLSARGDVSTGQTLLVPLNGEENDIDFDAFNMQIVPIDVRVKSLRHTVRRGDTYSTLAKRYHVSVANLKKLNRKIKTLKVGQAITISPAATSRKNTGHRYVSRKHANRYAASKHKGRGQIAKKLASRKSSKKLVRITAKNQARKVTKVAVRKRRGEKG
jgi:membrane-bound lytic murein transglycosylase D